MVDQAKVASAVQEVKELKELFDKIKNDSEELFARSKALSETGAHEAQELLDAAKSNWGKVLQNFSSGAGLSSLFATAIGKATKAAGKTSKKAAPVKKALMSKKTTGSKKAAPSKKTSGKKASKKSSKKK